VLRRRKPQPPKKYKKKPPRVVYEDELEDSGQVQVPQHPGVIIV
jgi:hypothetical protein